jgi:tryptophanyl-tRNA synthetase
MRIFSGIQPTGAKHLGNYAGGFRQYATTQEQGEAFFCIVDLHSISVEYDPEDRAERTSTCWRSDRDGLDPERSTIFAQSHVPRAAANWLLSSVASFGELADDAVQEKADAQEFVSAALSRTRCSRRATSSCTRPTSSRSGSTSASTSRLARNIAERFNSRYGGRSSCRGASIPGRRQDHEAQEPEKKMSTTGGTEQGTVLVLDPPDVIRRSSSPPSPTPGARSSTRKTSPASRTSSRS